MDSFNRGDTVRLKSGGPVMTVGGEAAFTGGLICNWFNDKDELKEHAFDPEMLESVDMNASVPIEYIEQP